MVRAVRACQQQRQAVRAPATRTTVAVLQNRHLKLLLARLLLLLACDGQHNQHHYRGSRGVQFEYIPAEAFKTQTKSHQRHQEVQPSIEHPVELAKPAAHQSRDASLTLLLWKEMSQLKRCRLLLLAWQQSV